MAGAQAGVRGKSLQSVAVDWTLRASCRQPWQKTGVQRPLLGEAFFTAAADCCRGGSLRLTVGIAANAGAGMAFNLPGGVEQKIAPLRPGEMSKFPLQLSRQLIERTVSRPEEALHAALEGFAAAEYAVFGRLEMLGAYGVVDEFALPFKTEYERLAASFDQKARQP